MRIGIVGSRRRNTTLDYLLVEEAFFTVYKEKDTIICSGGCPTGADNFAEKIAKNHGIPILIFFPNWDAYGKSASLRRNTDIARNSDILIACVTKDRKGGTEDTIKKFKQAHPKGRLIII